MSSFRRSRTHLVGDFRRTIATLRPQLMGPCSSAPLRFWAPNRSGRCRHCRHGLQDSNLCIICDQEAETLDHILLGCCFSREEWHRCLERLHIRLDFQLHQRTALEWWISLRKLVPQFFRHGFDSYVFLIGWSLWKERNNRTFRAQATNASRLAAAIREEADLWCRAGNVHLSRLLARAAS